MNFLDNRHNKKILVLASVFFTLMIYVFCIGCASGIKKGTLVGQAAPDFTLKDLNGNRVSLSDFKGKVVVLNFWATWCGPCRVEIPHIDALYQKYKDQGLVVLGINAERNHEKVEEFAKAKVSYTVLLDGETQVENMASRAFRPPFILTKRASSAITMWALVLEKRGRLSRRLWNCCDVKRKM